MWFEEHSNVKYCWSNVISYSSLETYCDAETHFHLKKSKKKKAHVQHFTFVILVLNNLQFYMLTFCSSQLTMLYLLLIGTSLSVLGSAVAQGTLDKYGVKNYPDPIDRYAACGRVAPSFICDPTNILPELKGTYSFFDIVSYNFT